MESIWEEMLMECWMEEVEYYWWCDFMECQDYLGDTIMIDMEGFYTNHRFSLGEHTYCCMDCEDVHGDVIIV